MTVTLDEAFVETTQTLPVTVTANGGATEADYSGIPENLTFAPGDTSKTFTVMVTSTTRRTTTARARRSASPTTTSARAARTRRPPSPSPTTTTRRGRWSSGRTPTRSLEGASQSITVTTSADFRSARWSSPSRPRARTGPPPPTTPCRIQRHLQRRARWRSPSPSPPPRTTLDDDNESVQLEVRDHAGQSGQRLGPRTRSLST